MEGKLTYYVYFSNDIFYGRTQKPGEAIGWAVELLLDYKDIRVEIKKEDDDDAKREIAKRTKKRG